MKLTFVDLNKGLCKKVEKLFNETENKTGFELSVFNGDVFEYKKENQSFKICTASNPDFSMGGGLDKSIAENYPNETKKLKEFVWTDNLFPIITVDDSIKSSRSIIKRALAGIFAYRNKFNFILTGIGTAIGGLSEDEFIEEVQLFLSADLSSADLRSANLSFADLSSADLSSADLSSADLSSADLRFADLSSANLSSANLRFANLRFANLSSADLSSADLRSANLSSADLSSADLSSADLSSANLRSANLRSADLSSANLSSANLRFANLRSAKIEKIIQNVLTINFNLACPEEGDFIGRKKCVGGDIVKLLIPSNAKRSSATTRKCRASKVKTLEIIGTDGKNKKETLSNHDGKTKYVVGKITKCDKREDDRWVECGGGIHFFITRLEAEQY